MVTLRPMPRPPWMSKAQRLIYENQWIRLLEHDVIRPDGENGLYSVVETKASATTIIVRKGEKYCVIREYRFPLGEFVWRFPTGGATPASSSLEAAKRELAEETGLVADVWRYIGRSAPISGLSPEIADVYLATEVRSAKSVDQQIELDISDVRFVSRREIDKMIRDAVFIDGQALAALAILDAAENRK